MTAASTDTAAYSALQQPSKQGIEGRAVHALLSLPSFHCLHLQLSLMIADSDSLCNLGI